MMSNRIPGYQQGAVLITSLIILVLMTLIGVTAMQNSTMEERMAGNLKELYRSFQAAEAGLREGEARARDHQPDSACTTSPCGTFTAMYASGDAVNPNELIPEYSFTLSEPTLKEFTTESGDTASGITDGGNLSMAIPTYRYIVDASGRVGSETAETVLRSVYVVADF